jgi:HlyD family secretion protein
MDDANLRGDLTQYRGQLAQQEANLNKILNGNRPKDIAQAQAKLNQAQAKLRQAEDDLQRNQSLFNQGAISQQTVNQKRSDRDSAQAEVNQAKAALNLQKRGARPEDIDTARAQVQAARGALQKIQVQLNDTKVVAPFDGVVIEKYADVGISAISCFEMAWLVRHGRIDLGMPFEDWLRHVEVALFNQCSKV